MENEQNDKYINFLETLSKSITVDNYGFCTIKDTSNINYPMKKRNFYKDFKELKSLAMDMGDNMQDYSQMFFTREIEQLFFNFIDDYLKIKVKYHVKELLAEEFIFIFKTLFCLLNYPLKEQYLYQIVYHKRKWEIIKSFNFSEQEINILKLLDDNFPKKEIAKRLVISEKTLDKYIQNIGERMLKSNYKTDLTNNDNMKSPLKTIKKFLHNLTFIN